jgi:hypothetical protein
MHLLLKDPKSRIQLLRNLGRGAAILAVALAVRVPGYAAEAKAPAAGSGDTRPTAVRAIADPATGSCWLLERDPAHPGGPGRLVPARGDAIKDCSAGRPRAAQGAVFSPFRPVIRGGDRLVVVEKTAVVEAKLEATALGPAVAGAELQVRLQIGGRVVRAVAVAPGRAMLAPGTGRW